MKTGLIGYGYWGPNLARNFNANPELDLPTLRFLAGPAQGGVGLYKQTKFVNDPETLFRDSDLDAVAIATPVSTTSLLQSERWNPERTFGLKSP